MFHRRPAAAVAKNAPTRRAPRPGPDRAPGCGPFWGNRYGWAILAGMSHRGSLCAIAVVAAVAAGCGSSSSGADAGGGHWFTTCGAPVCQVYDGGAPDSGVTACTTAELAGASCGTKGATCDPGQGCGVLLICADKDPKVQTGGCPISRRAAKQDIAYLDAAGLDDLAARLRAVRLATYRYKDNPARERLGFVIDDGAGRLAVDERRDQIDLYAYMSWAVGALQSQMKRIDAQDREIAALKRSLAHPPASPPRRRAEAE